jgi:hypothetical protein
MDKKGRIFMKHAWFIAIVICAIGLFGSPLEAGVVMLYTEETYTEPSEQVTHKAYLEGERVRVETKGENLDQVFIFRKDKEVFWIIDNTEGTFMEMSKAELQQAKGQMEQAMTMFEEQMKSLPPEQRKMAEEMMKAQMPVKSPKITYKKVATGERVNRWRCEKYVGYAGAEKKEEIWTADLREVDLKKEELELMKYIIDFFEEFSEPQTSFYRIGSEEWEKEQGYSGLPVKGVLFSEGRSYQKTELQEVERRDFSPSLFEVPAGLKKEKIPSGSMD